MNKLVDEYNLAIMRFPSFTLIEHLHNIQMHNPSYANNIYEKFIQQHVPRDILNFFVAQISRDAILLWRPSYIAVNPYDNLKFNLYEVFRLAAKYYIGNQCFKISDNQIFNASSFILRNIDLQTTYGAIHIVIARAIILFRDLPSKNDSSLFNNEFISHFNISIDDFLKSTILIFSIARKGRFNDNFTNKDGRLVVPTRTTLNTTVNLLSTTVKNFRTMHNTNLPTDNRFMKFNLNVLRIKPILKLSENPKQYIAPIPNLIINQLPSIIYYNMQQHANPTFTEHFGKELFENYIALILDKLFVCQKAIIFSEKQLKTQGFKNKKKPDFLIYNEQTQSAIIVEVKAARRYRGAIQTDDKDQFFGNSIDHIKEGITKIDNVSENLKKGTLKINNKNIFIKKVYGIIVTWENLVICNWPKIKKASLPNYCSCEYVHVLSLDDLELMTEAFESYDELIHLLTKLKNDDDPDTILRKYLDDKIKKTPPFLQQAINDFFNEIFKHKSY